MKTAFFAWLGLALELLAVFELLTSGRDIIVILLLVFSAVVLGLALFGTMITEERRHTEQLSEVARLWKEGER